MRIILNLKKKREQQVQGVHDGEHKKNSKQRQQKKPILRGTSKGGKKLPNRRTVWGTPTPSPFKKSTLAEGL